MSVKAKPDGYNNLIPYLMIKDCAGFVEFLKKAFNAQEMEMMKSPDGRLMHGELRLGDSVMMLSEANEQYPPATDIKFYLYVNDVDETYKLALAAGADSTMEPADQFYGDRNAGVKDKFGITWWIAKHVEDVTEEEMKRRHEEMMKKKS